MALYVNTNVSSLTAQRHLNKAVSNLNVSYQRLSSGLRINSAKDDAAGLQISNRLTSQINGLEQGNRNANDAIALAQVVEGALDETGNMLQRIRTLAVQSANGTNTEADRAAIQDEVTQLSVEINRIAQKTTFAGAQVLDGQPENDTAAKGSLISKDKGTITFQIGANNNDTVVLSLSTGFTISSMTKDNKVLNQSNPTAKDHGIAVDSGICRFSVTEAATAQKCLENIDKFIAFVDSKRAELGSFQNRLESTIRNQANVAENESDARSRIRDTDFASETAAMTQNNIIQQASQSILAQANQRPGLALQLLG